jgi:3-oxoacyl-[acyl-carrier protein] reductase
MLLAGKRCLVTGGSRGLGLAMCKAFARHGAKVALTYRRSDQDAVDAVKAVQSESPTTQLPLHFKGSVADAAHVQQTVAQLTAEWGGIDVLVNNAGVTQIVPIALLDEADWDEMLAVHVKGAYLFSRAVLKSMIRQKRGHILSIGSFSSERMIESPVHYAAAKSALRGFTEALGREVGRYNIAVNLLSPGLLDVGLGQMLLPHRIKEYVAQCPLGRLGTAAEVAEMAAFLVSEENTFMTGSKVVLDGGL